MASEGSSDCGNRWIIAAAAVLMLVPAGATSAWSLFERQLVRIYYPGQLDRVTLTFTLATATFGISAFLGGLWMGRVTPRVVGVAGGFLYGLGVFLAAFSGHDLTFLYLCYGVVGGIGKGLIYIVPIAVLLKWFPDMRGLVTGIGLMGLGAGELLIAPLASDIIAARGVLSAFGILGVLYGLVVITMALFMKNPPSGYQVKTPRRSAAHAAHPATRAFTLREAVRSWQWYALLAMLLLNATAGYALLSQAASMSRAMTGASVVQATALVSLIAIPNAAGRVLWPWLSDHIGPRRVFLTLLLLQVVIFLLLPSAHNATAFAVLAGAVLLCYGGGFGTMPAFVADYFGAEHVGRVYGLLLAPIGVSALFGPWLLANTRQQAGSYAFALYVLAAVLLCGAILPWVIRPPTQPHTAGVVPDRGAAKQCAG
ncbi:MAG: OFA family MFS transporter [Verrucomicrobia bacterium]|nr:OFA family MFS transporter [Verrucomicrobiota bacterium]